MGSGNLPFAVLIMLSIGRLEYKARADSKFYLIETVKDINNKGNDYTGVTEGANDYEAEKDPECNKDNDKRWWTWDGSDNNPTKDRVPATACANDTDADLEKLNKEIKEDYPGLGEKDIKAEVERINWLRAIHGSQPLEWSKEIEACAKKKAEAICMQWKATNCTGMDHSIKFEGSENCPAYENLGQLIPLTFGVRELDITYASPMMSMYIDQEKAHCQQGFYDKESDDGTPGHHFHNIVLPRLKTFATALMLCKKHNSAIWVQQYEADPADAWNTTKIAKPQKSKSKNKCGLEILSACAV